MSANSLAADLAKVNPRQIVRLRGYPDDGESEWHVNKAIQMQGAKTTIAIVLQKIDASEHWITAVLNESASGWVFETLTAFEGEKPADITADEHGNHLDADDLEVVDIRDQ